MIEFHHEIMPEEQLRIWMVCAGPTSKWKAYLAGGTSIALHLGHRRSVDFDWFTSETIRPAVLLGDMQELGFPVEVQQNDEGTFLSTVSGVSFTVFRYRYRLLGTPAELDGCMLASMLDLAAMKLLAIYQRGTKKDFIDVYAIMVARQLTLAQMLDAFCSKFGVSDTREVLRALTYFGDADALPMPHMLWPITWKEVKDGVSSAVSALSSRAAAIASMAEERKRPARLRKGR